MNSFNLSSLSDCDLPESDIAHVYGCERTIGSKKTYTNLQICIIKSNLKLKSSW